MWQLDQAPHIARDLLTPCYFMGVGWGWVGRRMGLLQASDVLSCVCCPLQAAVAPAHNMLGWCLQAWAPHLGRQRRCIVVCPATILEQCGTVPT